MIQNRIKEHVKVKASELVPHPCNFRKHPSEQRQALAASYEEIGFARSLLGYRLPDGRIQLIDGHLRAEFDPEMEVTVEVLDVTEEEANKLLLTVDPLAALAQTDEEVHQQLQDMVQTSSDALQDLWARTSTAARETAKALKKVKEQAEKELPPERYCVLIECQDEDDQVEKLRTFKRQGLKVKAIIA